MKYVARCQNPDCGWVGRTLAGRRDADLDGAGHELLAPDDDFTDLHPTEVEEAR